MPNYKIDYYEFGEKKTMNDQTGPRTLSLVSALLDDPNVNGILIFKEKN